MTALNAIPGYNELTAQIDRKREQSAAFTKQYEAALAAGNKLEADSYRQQGLEVLDEWTRLAEQRSELVDQYLNRDLASPTVTTSQSQSTPPANSGSASEVARPTEDGGTGAGTSTNPNKTINSDNNAKTTGQTSQFAVNVSTAALNEFIPTQPNQLDQYASYTYGLGWYLMSREQYNSMVASGRPNIAGWKLLMQSGGAPAEGRAQSFSLDYYMDDLEITTVVPTGGTRFAHSGLEIKFKVIEPNGITLIESIFKAVQSVNQASVQAQPFAAPGDEDAQQAPFAKTDKTLNYLTAHYCMVIRFYGYDKDGNLIAPAKGAFNTDPASGGFGQNAVITKYYPFTLTDIKFQIANRAIEYSITAKCTAHNAGFTTDRGTVVRPFTMTGQTVEQLLNGPSTTVVTPGVSPSDGRQDKPSPGQSVNDVRVNAGVDANGNFTGETQNPFAIVAP